MAQLDPDEAQRRLVLEALVAYSDACTLPLLTPNCPFYLVDDQGHPTCGTECVAAVQAGGGTGRSIRDVAVGGLVLTGRTVPQDAAGSADPFDAMRDYIDQRSLRPVDQSTGTLLLRLGAAMNRGPMPSANQSRMIVHEAWAELDRRRVPVESVVRAAILPQMAAQIGMQAMTPLLRQSGMWAELVSDDELDRLDQRSAEWFAVLDRAYEEDRAGLDDDSQILQWVNIEAHRRKLDEVFRLHEATEQVVPVDVEVPETLPAKLAADLRVVYATSTRFTTRVEQWLNRILTDDLNAVIDWTAPPPALFSALPALRRMDETGLWIWDRFTKTSLEDWATSSLLREWAGNSDVHLDRRVWLERVCDSEVLAEMALSRLTKKPRRAAPPPKLTADVFVDAAQTLLKSDRPEEAAQIFQGLVDLNPTDGDALNNLGFCLLPTDPPAALEVLQRSSLFPMAFRAVNAANRVLALLLVGRESDALTLARESLRVVRPSENDHCVTWRVESTGETPQLSLQSSSPHAYLMNLTEFLESRL
ncbi:hypothetical protein ASC64_04455 [Nocardioides sp. Root122]|uniref:tetratricopeptide repeat protein n=1 Tax=Nocardioides TaxID=1839 RepID=UPI00070282F1|nr:MULTISPECIES: hypothetical protein [Nocardioides]KQV71301.1 hypothetical protein ASC64_04455 [Nocardioides sp. Root122]MCK9822747.1 hypothetical protein [Nocardioides cavernae]